MALTHDHAVTINLTPKAIRTLALQFGVESYSTYEAERRPTDVHTSNILKRAQAFEAYLKDGTLPDQPKIENS